MAFKNIKAGKSGSGVLVLYIGAAVIGLVAIGLLVDNIIIFRNTILQYVAQGYPYNELVRQLLPSQLLPGVFEAVAVYGGIALILFGVGRINEKVSNSLGSLGPAGPQIPVADNTGDEHAQPEEDAEDTES